MEINYTFKYNKMKVEIDLASSLIIGINTKDTKKITNILSLNEQSTITVDNKKILKKDIEKFKDKIETVKEEIDINNINTIYEYLLEKVKEDLIEIKNIDKKFKASLKIVGIEKDINYDINKLSTTELKLLSLARALLKNPDIIVLEEPFIRMSYNTKKSLILLFNRLRDELNKIVVIVSKQNEDIYKYTNYSYLINEKSFIKGISKDIFENSTLLKENKFNIPIETIFTDLVNKKTNISYHRDTRDILKDIYKHI